MTSSKNIRIIDELGEGVINTNKWIQFMYTLYSSSTGAFCKVHRGVMVSEEGGYHIEKHVAVKHLKGEVFFVVSFG